MTGITQSRAIRAALAAALLLAFEAPAGAASGKHPAPAAKPAAAAMPDAEQIVARNAAARGGLAKWRAVQSLTLAGVLDLGQARADTPKDVETAGAGRPRVRRSLAEAGLRRSAQPPAKAAKDEPPGPDVKLPFTLSLKRPHKSRLELVFDQQTAVQTYDGQQGWKLRPFSGRKEAVPLSPVELKAAAAQQELDGLLIDHAAKGIRVAVEKSEAVNGHDAWRLRLTLKNGEERHVWVDAKTFLEVKADTPPRRVDGVMRTVATYYSDYRPVDGLMIPFVVETRMEGGRRSGKMLIERVQVNPKLDDKGFGKPA